ncbi:MAG: hypothetical protein AAFY14_02685 [Pseudomonadota bacterium]
MCAFTSVPTHAQSNDPDAQLRTFAACVGRLSAVVEYEWNMMGAVSSETTLRRDAAAEIVAAIIPTERSRDVLQWRNAAKQAQWSLLNRATSTRDTGEASWALQQAQRFETACTSLLTL